MLLLHFTGLCFIFVIGKTFGKLRPGHNLMQELQPIQIKIYEIRGQRAMRAAILAIMLLLAPLAAVAQTGTWSGTIEVQGIKLPLVFHIDGENSTADSPDQGVKGILARAEWTDGGLLVVSIPSIGAEYRGLFAGRWIAGTFTQRGVSFPMTLVPGEQKRNRPQTPQPPLPYAQEEVAFSNGEAVLRGTLTLPAEYTRQTPVLLMVTGSGLQNRDEEIFEHKPFAVIADALARAGIATLRYDDRGFGDSSGDAVNCTTEDLKNDALAGVGLLRERFDRVGVIGHSEGGTIAMMLAAEQQADFIVSLAGMAVSGTETLLWQNRQFMTAAGYPARTVEAYCELLAEAFGAAVRGEAPPPAENTALPDELIRNYEGGVRQLQIPYMRYFLALDMRPRLGAITCPVLALNGTRDTQVFCDANLEALRTGLPLNEANRTEAAEGLNHLFQHCTTGAVSEYGDIEETFAPEVLERIVRWLKGLRFAD